MMTIYLDSMKKIVGIVKVCEKYTPDIQTDAISGRYIVDAASLLGLESLTGKFITLNPHVYNKDEFGEYKKEIMQIPGIANWEDAK